MVYCVVFLQTKSLTLSINHQNALCISLRCKHNRAHFLTHETFAKPVFLFYSLTYLFIFYFSFLLMAQQNIITNYSYLLVTATV